MELRRLGEPLLRSQAAPMLSFLAPSFTLARRQAVHTQQARRVHPISLRQPCHGFHTTNLKNVPSSSDPLADLDFLDDTTEQSHIRPPPDSPTSRRLAGNAKIDSLLNSTLEVPVRKPYKPPTETSAIAVDTNFRASQYYNLRDRGNRSPGSLSRDMAFPGVTTDGDTNKAIGTSQPQDVIRPIRMQHTIISRPSVGRTIQIDPLRGPDFGRALGMLNIQCAVNKVRTDQIRQRFHERPGLKRKRLKSERWRKLFKESFKATVNRVKEMRRKGW